MIYDDMESVGNILSNINPWDEVIAKLEKAHALLKQTEKLCNSCINSLEVCSSSLNSASIHLQEASDSLSYTAGCFDSHGRGKR